MRQWVYERTGFDGWWESVQLDRAVSWFGRYVENKLSDYDKDGKPNYTLDELLTGDTEPPDIHMQMRALGAMFGTINR